jgi:hypothetical protein
MGKGQLLEIIQSIQNTDVDLSFVVQLEESELEILVTCIRDRIDQLGK